MSKNRYVFLDGLRGVAAIFVFMRHSPFLWGFHVGHGYLAVDLFFALSGFVIAHAYDKKLASGSLTISSFIRVRLIRLYPIYALSVLLCIPIYLLTKYYSQNFTTQGLYLATALALFFIPYRMGSVMLFGINIPYWSLFFELIANILYVIVRPILSTNILRLVVACTGLILGAGTIYSDAIDFGVVSQFSSAVGGLFRALFGFSVGLLLHRYSERIESGILGRISPWIAMVTVAGVLAAPSIPRFDIVIDLIAVYIIFPLVIAIGSNRREPRFSAILLILGSASYPLYVLHVPLITFVGVVFRSQLEGMAPTVGLALLASLIALSIGLEKFYDIPIRRWLLGRTQTSSLITQLRITFGKFRDAVLR